MVTERLPKSARNDRAGKRAGRRARGIQVVDRAGVWYVHAALRLDGRARRIRKSLGLAVAAVSQDAAETAADDYIAEIKARAAGKVGRGDPVSVAALAFLSRQRERPLRATTINIVKEAEARFGARRLNEIPEAEWKAWVDGDPNAGAPGRMTGLTSSTRERFLNGVMGFLTFAKKHHGLATLPTFTRDRAATNPNRRKRRRVEDLRPELLRLLFEHAHIAIRAQLAVECDTGARVSSIIHGSALCDLHLANPKEKRRASMIIFRGTKNGLDVHAALSATAARILKDYLKWRGNLHDREAPLFLTPRRETYVDNGREWGTQNKTAFNGAKRRAQKAAIAAGAAREAKLRSAGRGKAANQARDQAAADAELLGKITQHWFRHRLAQIWLRKDPRAAMEQGGWLDIRSLMGYAADVPEYRQQLAAELDAFKA